MSINDYHVEALLKRATYAVEEGMTLIGRADALEGDETAKRVMERSRRCLEEAFALLQTNRRNAYIVPATTPPIHFVEP